MTPSTTPVYANTYPDLQSAIDATPLGGTLFLPAGDYPLSGSGAQILLVTKGITIQGEGPGSRLLVASTVPNTTDIIKISGPGQIAGLHLSDFSIEAESGKPGRYGINLDAGAGTNPIADATLARLSIGRFGSEGLAIVGPTPPSFDGVFTSAVRECSIQGGMLLERAGIP